VNFYEKALFVKSRRGGRPLANAAALCPSRYASIRTLRKLAVGRAKLRERIGVEHSLWPIGHWQGERARYIGARKNLFDLRRSAVVHNLHVIARSMDEPQPAEVA
jgi:hypothetical protein